MKNLTESDIVQIIREEWGLKVKKFYESVDAVITGKVDGKEALLISQGLKVRHKKTQLLYTVAKVEAHDVILKTPEGKMFSISKDELEKDYEID